MNTPSPISYKRHRYPAAIISQCVWLYFRFALSFRDVELMMADRGIVVTYESVRAWCEKFGREYARRIRHLRGPMGHIWHMDEVYLKINGVCKYLWRAVDQEGQVFQWDTVTRNGVNHDRDKKAQRSPASRVCMGFEACIRARYYFSYG